jgi:hypothetical protein
MKLLLTASFSFHAYNATARLFTSLLISPKKLFLFFSTFYLSLKNFLLPGKLYFNTGRFPVDYFKRFNRSDNKVFLFRSGTQYKLISGFV